MTDGALVFFEIFPWDKNFETGIPKVDEQHQELVRILNRLAAHLANLSSPVVLNDVFAELADYAHYHFETEEAVWKSHLDDDEWFLNHEQTHHSFIEKVVELRQLEGSQPIYDVVQEIVSFLTHWLAFHILDNDKRMALAVQAIESGSTPAAAKQFATEQMSGSMQVLIETVLSMYSSLSNRTLHLMREKSLRLKAEQLVQQRTVELNDAADYNRALFETTPVGLVVCDSEGTLVDANDAFLDLIGYAREQALSRHYWDLISVEGMACEQEWLALLQQAETVKSDERELITKNGQRITVFHSSRLIRQQGRSLIFCAIEDVRMQKVAERRLIEAKELADSANRAKGDFLAKMSHEIRTPMSAVIGMTHLALQTELGAKQRNYIEKAHHAAEGLLDIVNDIVDFSKIESGHLELERIEFGLIELLEKQANLIAVAAQKKQLELMFDLDARLPSQLMGDPLRLGQVLTNLGNNAVKFTECGGEVVIGVRLASEERLRIQVQFTVTDTGIGMTAEELSRLFQSFSQADRSISRQYGGSGLGLVICQSLVALMGGSITVDSVKGEGSTFTFMLWFDKPEQLQPSANSQLSQRKLMVIDDCLTSQKLLTQLMNDQGAEVRCFNSGEAALSELMRIGPNRQYDAVLIDSEMPDLNGVQTAEVIKRLPDPKPPLILMSPLYGNIASLGEERLFAAYLTKPVLLNHLIKAVLEAVDPYHTTEVNDQSADGDVDTAALIGAKLLLVEDNEINQELAVELLSGYGIYLTVAEHGQQALDLLANEPFDGVLMDIQMPVMDGYTACEKIRAQSRFADLPIIAMTANAMLAEREKVLAVGMNDQIDKPFNLQQMLLTLRKWIRPASPSKNSSTIQNVEENYDQEFSFEEIVGVDRAAGLTTCNGNEALFQRLLFKFGRQQGAFEEKFLALQSAGDRDGMIRLAHTLKGVAGNIGAHAISRTASQLEEACKLGSDEIEPLLEQLQLKLQSVVDQLQQLERQQQNLTNNQGVVVSKQQFDELLELITTNNIHAIDFLHELQPGFISMGYRAQFDQINEALESYDFEQALTDFQQFQQ